MSSRQLRKLQKQKELESVQLQATAEEEEEDGSGAEQAPTLSKPRVSLFAALGGDQDEDEEQEDVEAPEPVPVNEESLGFPQPASSGKSKKRKKKKKKGKAAGALTQDTPITKDEDVEDEIDKAIKELNIKSRRDDAALASGDTTESTRGRNEVFKISSYHLKAVNEMRNLFGRDIIDSAAAQEEQDERDRHLRGGQQPQQVDLETFLRTPPNAKKLPEVSLRRNVFIQGREHWPLATANGLTMREIEKADDGSCTEYAYVHEGEYDIVQGYFFNCVQGGDPLMMIQLLRTFPYHVSTLLQVSSIAKQDQNMALAAELCERALFTFGRTTTPAFRQNLEQGKARLDFRRPENRQFWLAGYHYIKSLIRKGTYRTALEWAKLLYMLDPTDPYAMRHYIHYLAIRAHESRWLVEFMDEMANASDNRDTDYLRQSLVLAKLQLGDVEGARADLAQGMQRLPWLYCAMFQELNLDTPPSIWGIGTDSHARLFHQRLYISQAKDLWNNTQATGLLQDVARSLDKVDTAVLPKDDASADLGATRLAFLDGQTSIIAVAPRDLLDRQPNYEFDPLPPPYEQNILTSQATALAFRQTPPHLGAAENQLGERIRNPRDQGPPAEAVDRIALENLVDVDEEELAAIDADLQRGIEEHLERQRENRPGILGTMMNMLRGFRGGNGEQQPPASETDEAQDLPGAFPEGHGDGGARDVPGHENRGDDGRH